jgi:hypothetical protein
MLTIQQISAFLPDGTDVAVARSVLQAMEAPAGNVRAVQTVLSDAGIADPADLAIVIWEANQATIPPRRAPQPPANPPRTFELEAGQAMLEVQVPDAPELRWHMPGQQNWEVEPPRRPAPDPNPIEDDVRGAFGALPTAAKWAMGLMAALVIALAIGLIVSHCGSDDATTAPAATTTTATETAPAPLNKPAPAPVPPKKVVTPAPDEDAVTAPADTTTPADTAELDDLRDRMEFVEFENEGQDEDIASLLPQKTRLNSHEITEAVAYGDCLKLKTVGDRVACRQEVRTKVRAIRMASL